MDAMAGRLCSRSCCRPVGLLILGPSDLGPTSTGAASAKSARHLWGDTKGTLRPRVSRYPFSSPPLKANIPVTKSDPVCFLQFPREKAATEPPSLQRGHPGLTRLPRLTLAPHVHQQWQGPFLPLAHCREGGIGCESLRGSAEPRASVTGTRGSHPEHARSTASQAGSYSRRPGQQMANPVEMLQQQEKGPWGVSTEVRDPKGRSPQDPEATPSHSCLLCRDAGEAPRDSTFCTRQTVQPQEPVIPPDPVPSLWEWDAGASRPPPAKQEGCRGKRCPASRPGSWHHRAHNPHASEVLSSAACFHAARANHCIKIFPLRQHRTRGPRC